MQAHMKSTLQQLLSDGKTDQVIAELRRLTAPDPYLHEQFLLLAGRQAELERKTIAGTSSADDLDIERNKIRAALLILVKKLREEGTGDNATTASISGTTVIQQAEKIYNINHIDNADFS